MNIPNALTLVRLALIPVYLWAFYGTESPHKVVALGILVLAGLTDILDGALARNHGWVTPIGQLLDPLADKLMMVAVFFSLIESSRVPWLVACLLVFRDVAMIAGSTFFYFQGKRQVPAANWWGKMTTLCYYISISVVILAWPSQNTGLTFLWFTVALSYLTTVLYVVGMRIVGLRRLS